MTGYWATVSARFRTLLQYRSAALAGTMTQLFWEIIRVMVFTAFFRSTITAQPMTLEDVPTYIWISQALFVWFPWGPDRDVHTLIRSGAISFELVRPVDLYTYWFSRAIALRTAPNR